MPSSTSNFKRKLRLPRLFFAKPSEIIPRDYERPIPPLPWRGLTVIVVLIVIAAASAWEFYCRSIGYRPTLNDNEDLWTMTRRSVKPESIVIIGDSRVWFDLDLDELQKGLGKRPVSLRWAEAVLTRYWRISLTTKIFTERLYVAWYRACSSPHPAHRRRSAGKKQCAGRTFKRLPNVPANIWRCHWKNMSRSSNRRS